MIKVKKKNKLVYAIREKIMGNPNISSVSTSVVEDYNK
jgi:hypothetical protein